MGGTGKEKPWGRGCRNTAQGMWNPTKDWNPESKFHYKENWNQVPGIRNPRRGIQNPRLSWIALHVAIPNRTYQGESKGFTVHTFNIKSDSAHSALR